MKDQHFPGKGTSGHLGGRPDNDNDGFIRIYTHYTLSTRSIHVFVNVTSVMGYHRHKEPKNAFQQATHVPPLTNLSLLSLFSFLLSPFSCYTPTTFPRKRFCDPLCACRVLSCPATLHWLSESTASRTCEYMKTGMPRAFGGNFRYPLELILHPLGRSGDGRADTAGGLLRD